MKLDFEHIVSDLYQIQRFNGSWLSDHEIVYVDQNGSIVILDADTNKTTTLVKMYDKTLHTMASFQLSPDRQSILFVQDVRRQFGAVTTAKYAVFNVSSQTVEFIDDLIKSSYPLKAPQVKYAAWGPKANSLFFVESNDIYFVPDFAAHTTTTNTDSTTTTAGVKIIRLTKTGELSEYIRNGIPDSLYRNRIFNARDFHADDEAAGGSADMAAIWWSPDGRYLSYLSFDDALVEAVPIEYYDSYLHDTNTSPKIHYERYPRAGAINPRVSVHVVDLAPFIGNADGSGSVSVAEFATINPPADLTARQQQDPRMGYYVTYVDWISPPAELGTQAKSQLLIMWSGRAHNSSILTICSSASESSKQTNFFGQTRSASSLTGAGDWSCEILTTFSLRTPPSTNAKTTILSAFDSFGSRLIFFALPRPDSVIGDHYHVAMLKAGERSVKYLTHGEYDIDRLLSYDVASDTLYFEAKVGETAERHLYKISSIKHSRQTRCLTCTLADRCAYNYAHLNRDHVRYMVHECLGPQVPRTTMLRLSSSQIGIPDNNQSLNSRLLVGDELIPIATLGLSPHLESLLKTKQMPIEKFIAIKTNRQLPYDVHIKLYLPNEVEEEKDKKFPLLIESTEIDSRKVWRKFELDWGQYLASRKQLVYAKIDCIPSRSFAASATGANSSPQRLLYSGHQPAVAQQQLQMQVQLESAADEAFIQSAPLVNAQDQVDVIKFIVDNADLFPYIDKRRIAIWGPTSTASYVALATTIEDDAKMIGCTMAVAPITNWKYMDSYTAERYLGLPFVDANNLKYEQANLLKRSYEFAARKLLIVHGTADEQVHVQHSMQFIKSLTERHLLGGVIHQTQLYPDTGHSMAAVKKHFFLTLDGFVDRCFYQKPITIKATEWKGKVRPKLY